jgi:hypothetical protein
MKTTTGKTKQQPPMPKRFFVYSLNHNPKMIQSEFSIKRILATGKAPRQITYWLDGSFDGSQRWNMHDPRPNYSKPFSKKRCQTRLSRSEKILRGEL